MFHRVTSGVNDYRTSQQIPLLLIYVKIRTQISLKCKRTLIYFAGSSRIKERPPTGKRNSVQGDGGW